MKKIYKQILLIVFIFMTMNVIYSQSQAVSTVVNDLGFNCDSLSGFNIDSVLSNKYLILKEWTSSTSTRKDTVELIETLNNSDAYKNFIKKEEQIRKYKPMLSLYHFPEHSKIIEVKDLKQSGIQDRAIVYWIQYPTVAIYIEEDYDCYSSMMGHGQYIGKVKFSLLNTKEYKIINTIDLNYEEYISEFETNKTYISKDECLQLPFTSPSRKSEMALGSRVEYKIIGGNDKHEGLTEILYLDDYNGDSSKLEFAIYMASGGCMGTESTLLGYSKKKDQLIHYPVEIKEISKDSTNKEIIENISTYWLSYTFTLRFKDKKLKYQMDWRGRGGCLSKYDLQYDDKKECFTGIVDERETEYKEGEKAYWISMPDVE